MFRDNLTPEQTELARQAAQLEDITPYVTCDRAFEYGQRLELAARAILSECSMPNPQESACVMCSSRKGIKVPICLMVEALSAETVVDTTITTE